MPVILQINVTANWGSTGRIAEEIGRTIMRENWVSYIAYGRNKGESSSQLIRIGKNRDIYFHILSTRLFDRHGLSSRRATEQLIERIIQIHPDIIHIHNIHGYYLNYPILFNYLSECGIPVVWTLHDCWPFTGHCAHYDFAGCDRWITKCHDCPQKKCYPSSYFRDRSKKNFDEKKSFFLSGGKMILVPVSNWLAAEIRKSFLRDVAMQVIHNGIDTDVFQFTDTDKARLRFDGKTIVLGVASRWNSHKGLKDFIQLRKLLSAEYIIVLIGVNKKQIETLPEGVVGVQRTNNIQELVEYYSMAEVFVNPTWEDNFPTVNLEALSCGTPVVTYKTGGSVEAIDKETGYVVEKGDVQGLVDRIDEICRAGKKTYMKACRNRVTQFFDKNDRYTEYLSLYKKLLSQ